KPAAEAIRLAAPTQHAFTVGLVHGAAGWVHLCRGDWAKAHPHVEHATAVLRAGNVALQLSLSLASSASVLAQLGEASEALSRLREGEELLARNVARGHVAVVGQLYRRLGQAALVLGRIDDAVRLGNRAIEFSSPLQPGHTAHALQLLGDVAAHPG